MFKYFYPYEYVDSVFSIDFEKLFNMGFRGIIFDIDNTLVHHGEKSNRNVDNLFKEIQQMGFKTTLLTDNTDERVHDFITNINTSYTALAQKPKPKGYKKSIEILGLDKSEVVYIGDQIFTDILGANICSIKCILVDFMRKSDETHFGKRRNVERKILNYYQRNTKYMNRLGDIKK